MVDSYRSETAEREKEMAQLTDTVHPQVFQVTRCASCGGQLDLPSVHFMCKHSYHQRYVSGVVVTMTCTLTFVLDMQMPS